MDDKTKQLAYNRAYYLRNKVEIKARAMVRYRNRARTEKDRERSHAYYLRNTARIKAYVMAWQKRNPERRRGYAYRIPVDEVRRLYSAPCAICGSTVRKRVIDHNHETGEVRGSLCNGCNALVSYLETCPELVPIAFAYLGVPQ